MAKRKPKPEQPVPVDPTAEVFAVGDKVVVKRRVLWTGYFGTVEKVEGGMCRVRLDSPETKGYRFSANIPAKDLRKEV